MTATTIAVEDVDVEPEDSRVEAAGSEALTKEPIGSGGGGGGGVYMCMCVRAV